MTAIEVSFISNPVIALKLLQSFPSSIISDKPIGPLGHHEYKVIISSKNENDINDIAAIPYYFAILDYKNLNQNFTEDYAISENEFTKMCSMYCEEKIGSKPSQFQKLVYKTPPTIHYYPIYGNDPLYMTENESKLFNVDVSEFVGYVGISTNLNALLLAGSSTLTVVNNIISYELINESEEYKNITNNINQELLRSNRKGIGWIKSNDINNVIANNWELQNINSIGEYNYYAPIGDLQILLPQRTEEFNYFLKNSLYSNMFNEPTIILIQGPRFNQNDNKDKLKKQKIIYQNAIKNAMKNVVDNNVLLKDFANRAKLTGGLNISLPVYTLNDLKIFFKSFFEFIKS